MRVCTKGDTDDGSRPILSLTVVFLRSQLSEMSQWLSWEEANEGYERPLPKVDREIARILNTAPRRKFPRPATSVAKPFRQGGSNALQISPIRATAKRPTLRARRRFHLAHMVRTTPLNLLKLNTNPSSPSWAQWIIARPPRLRSRAFLELL